MALSCTGYVKGVIVYSIYKITACIAYIFEKCVHTYKSSLQTLKPQVYILILKQLFKRIGQCMI